MKRKTEKAAPKKPVKAKAAPTVLSEGIEKRQRNLIPFKPGESGNPAGRPKGSRNRLNEEFIVALFDDFQLHGKDVIATVRAEKPDAYLKVVASLQPKEIDIRDKTVEDMTDQELYDALAEIRSIKALINGGAASKGRTPTRGEKAASKQLN